MALDRLKRFLSSPSNRLCQYISDLTFQRNHQNSDKDLEKNTKGKMKLAVATIVAVASAQDKKVPPRHPLQRLNKLNIFAAEWCNANLSEKAAANWEAKFERNVKRFERRFELCGFYDENQLPHGGPKPSEDRKRREEDDLAFLDCEGSLCPRYDKNNPVRGIQQITKGFAKWAQRYVSTCKLQPAKQVERSNKWFGQLTGKLNQE